MLISYLNINLKKCSFAQTIMMLNYRLKLKMKWHQQTVMVSMATKDVERVAEEKRNK